MTKKGRHHFFLASPKAKPSPKPVLKRKAAEAQREATPQISESKPTPANLSQATKKHEVTNLGQPMLLYLDKENPRPIPTPSMVKYHYTDYSQRGKIVEGFTEVPVVYQAFNQIVVRVPDEILMKEDYKRDEPYSVGDATEDDGKVTFSPYMPKSFKMLEEAVLYANTEAKKDIVRWTEDRRTDDMKSEYLGLKYVGKNRVEEIPKNQAEKYFGKIPIEIAGKGTRAQTFNEGFLGMGTLYSITDYGDYKRFSKKSLIDKMRKTLMGEPDESGISHHVQYIDVVDKKTGDIANKLVISTSRSGYSVIPVFGETTAKKPDLFATFMEERAMKQGAAGTGSQTDTRTRFVEARRNGVHPDWAE